MSAIRYLGAAALTIGVAALTAAPRAASAQGATEKKLIVPAGTTNMSPALAPGILVGNTLYLTGVTPPRALRDSSVAQQTEGAINNVKAVLQAAGMDLSDVVAVTVYLADINDFNAMNGAYAKMFTTDPRPTRTTVAVAGLVGGAKLEITMTAVKTK